MYTVLVPFDQNEERATAQADAVRRLPDAKNSVEALLLHVADQSDEGSDPMEISAGKHLRDTLSEAGLEVEVKTRTGDPAEWIIAVAEEYGVDQIILGGRKRSPLGTLLFGSVSQQVVLDAARPVTVTGSEVKEEPSHRCQDCGRSYYSKIEDVDIDVCRDCGGTNVEEVHTEAPVQ